MKEHPPSRDAALARTPTGIGVLFVNRDGNIVEFGRGLQVVGHPHGGIELILLGGEFS